MNICENYENLWKLSKFMKCVRFCDFFWKFHKCNWTERGQIWRFGALGTFSCVFSGFQRIKDMPSVAPGRNQFMLAWVPRFALGTRFPLKEVLKVNGVLDAPRARCVQDPFHPRGPLSKEIVFGRQAGDKGRIRAYHMNFWLSKIQTRKLAASTGRRNVGRRFFCSNWPCQVLIIVRPAVRVNLLPRGLLITGHGHNHWWIL